MNLELIDDQLLGKTITEITGAEEGGDRIEFTMYNGERYVMFHNQDCCEYVYIKSIEGDIQDLIGQTLTMAEVATQEMERDEDGYDDSGTWTFYKFATIKGYVTITWLGTSNGYYSESVEFVRM